MSLECTAKLHFKGPQRPVEHRCRLTLGANREQNGTSSCFITVEGDACQRRKFKVSVLIRTTHWLGGGFKRELCHCILENKLGMLGKARVHVVMLVPYV